MFPDFEYEIVVGIRTLGNLTQKTAESNDTIKHTAGS